MQSAPTTGFLETALRPLDAARREILVRGSRWPWVGRALRRWETRTLLLVCASVTFAFVMTCLMPGVLFVLGPALLGVPHVASDVRYLVLRQGLPRRWVVSIVAFSMALVAWRTLELVVPRALPFSRVEVGLGWSWAIAGAWFGAWAARRWRRAAVLTLPLAAVALLAVSYPGTARALFAYGHNLFALVAWTMLCRRRRIQTSRPFFLIAATTAILATGMTLPALHLASPWAGRLLEEAAGVTPRLGPRTASIVALTYVFLQAVHYSVWLVFIPQEQLRGEATLTFRMSARAALYDFGRWGLAFIVLAAVAVLAFSFVSVHRTRGIYLSVATFHAYLEVACLSFLWARDRKPS
jgi:hypothetical protein